MPRFSGTPDRIIRDPVFSSGRLWYREDMIITISGHPGSGKGTVGKMLAKKLGYRYFSIGDMRRAMARERGMTLQEFNVLGERQDFTDTDVDRWQAKLGRMKDNLVVEGRTSFHFIPHSIKLFFAADLAVAAKRIFADTAHARQFEATKRYTTVAELEHGLRHRIASDSRRYQKYYGLNIFKKSNYDLWVDTTKQRPIDTLQVILKYLANISQKVSVVDTVGRKNVVLHKKTTKKATGKTLYKKAKISKKKR